MAALFYSASRGLLDISPRRALIIQNALATLGLSRIAYLSAVEYQPVWQHDPMFLGYQTREVDLDLFGSFICGEPQPL